jgi:hypothetical protein
MAGKLTEDIVRRIRRGASEGQSPREIGMLFGVATETIRRIVRRETWAHVADVEAQLFAAELRAEVEVNKPLTAGQVKAAMESQDKLLGMLGRAGKVDIPEAQEVLNPVVRDYLKGNAGRIEPEGDLTE